MAQTQIGTDGIKNDAVTTAKIADNAVTAQQIQSNTIQTGNIVGGAITTDRIANDAVNADKLANSINTAIAANTAKDLTALSASNLTSGTIPDARLPATLPAISGANLTNLPAGGKPTNLVLNGAMELAQRGTSSTVYGYGSVDRWRNTQSGITVTPTHSQETATSSDTGIWEAGFRKYLRWSLPSAGTNSAASWLSSTQFIEAQDVASSGWNYTSTSDYITVSFWIRASTNQTFYANLGTRDGTRKRFSFAITASGNNTWTKITKTIPGHADLQFDLNDDRGLDVQITVHYGTDYTGTATLDAWVDNSGTNSYPDYATTWLTAGASTFDITGVQLEIGNSASDFAHESYNETLRKCQRYYYVHAEGAWKSIGVGVMYQGSNMFTFIKLPVNMRNTPTLDQTTGTNYYSAYLGASADEWTGFGGLWNATDTMVGLNVGTGQGLSLGSDGQSAMVVTANAAAFLAFSAEL